MLSRKFIWPNPIQIYKHKGKQYHGRSFDFYHLVVSKHTIKLLQTDLLMVEIVTYVAFKRMKKYSTQTRYSSCFKQQKQF
jgi:hypothetical protein